MGDLSQPLELRAAPGSQDLRDAGRSQKNLPLALLEFLKCGFEDECRGLMGGELAREERIKLCVTDYFMELAQVELWKLDIFNVPFQSIYPLIQARNETLPGMRAPRTWKLSLFLSSLYFKC